MAYESIEDDIEAARKRRNRFGKFLPDVLCRFLFRDSRNREEHHLQRREEAEDAFDETLKTIQTMWSPLESDIGVYLQNYHTYLTADRESELKGALDDIEVKLEDGVADIDWDYLKENEQNEIDQWHERIQQVRDDLSSYNSSFVKRRNSEYDYLFSDIDKAGHDLNFQQRKAVIRDDTNNLVIAGAGSGKTAVLTHRIEYLMERTDRVPADDIIALTYNSTAVDMIEERLCEEFGITEPTVSTFHSLGLDILEEDLGFRPDVFGGGKNGGVLSKWVEERVSRYLRHENGGFKRHYFKFLKHFYDEEGIDADFAVKERQAAELRETDYKTLRGEEVRSRAEKMIADTLFLNQIDYSYEHRAGWAETGEEYGGYDPDFYLPEHEITIEHWGIWEDGEVGSHFSQTTEEYHEKMRWARQLFDDESDRTLVETYDFERKNGTLQRALKIRLQNHGVTFNPMSYEDLVESSFDYRENRKRIRNLFCSFIKNARQLDLSAQEIDSRTGDRSTKANQFHWCAARLLMHFTEYLNSSDQIDFPGMLHRAVDVLERNPNQYRNRYAQVLVDEFQDVSPAEIDFLKALIPAGTDTRLFCVGDDWQAIYGFNGAEVRFFLNFEEHFEEATITHLDTNYRSPAGVIDAGEALIQENEVQIDKETIPASDTEMTPKLYSIGAQSENQFDEHLAEVVVDRIVELGTMGANWGDILVLSRTKFKHDDVETLCHEREIPTTRDSAVNAVRLYSGHAAKGEEAPHTIVTHVTNGRYGFPIQVEDSELLTPVQLNAENRLPEERRLLYVALSRAEETLDIFTWDDHQSPFIDDFREQVTTPETLASACREDRLTIKDVHVDEMIEEKTKMQQEGWLEDRSTRRRFIIWEDADLSDLELDKQYTIENARVRKDRSGYSVQLDSQTKVKRVAKSTTEKPRDQDSADLSDVGTD